MPAKPAARTAAAPAKAKPSAKAVQKPAKPVLKLKPALKGTRTDYEAVERDYRTGSFTDQELATKYGKSRQAITKMAKVKGWKKDLSLAVRQATKALVIAEAVKEKVAEQVAKGSAATLDSVLVAAETNKQVILGHRRDILSARNLLNGMLTELQQVSVNPRKLHDLLEVLTGEEDMTASQVADARAAFSDLQRLPTRILSMTRLSQAMSKLQQLERQAFGLDDDIPPPPENELTDLSDEELERRIEESIERRSSRGQS